MVFLGAKNPVTMQLLILTIWPHFYHLIFFVISNTSNNIIVVYFTCYLVNGNRAMIEINIFSAAAHFVLFSHHGIIL
jgi:Na+/melibiose symporter-like transporter